MLVNHAKQKNREYENKMIYKLSVLLYKGDLKSNKGVVENTNTGSGGKALRSFSKKC